MDKTSKILIALLVISILANTAATLIRPASALAAREMQCKGRLRTAMLGYEIDLRCSE